MSVVVRAWSRYNRSLPLDAWPFWIGIIAGGAVALIFLERAINDRGDAFLWAPLAVGGCLLVWSCLISGRPIVAEER